MAWNLLVVSCWLAHYVAQLKNGSSVNEIQLERFQEDDVSSAPCFHLRFVRPVSRSHRFACVILAHYPSFNATASPAVALHARLMEEFNPAEMSFLFRCAFDARNTPQMISAALVWPWYFGLLRLCRLFQRKPRTAVIIGVR